MIAPMIIWLIISIRRRQLKTILYNALCMIAGVLIVSAPILLFYALHHAIDDLFYVYFYINLTAYRSSESMVIFKSIGVLFTIGPAILFLIFLGIIRFSILHWKEKTGWLLLISFLTTLTFLILTSKGLVYYYGSLFPYGILGVIYIVKWLTYSFVYKHIRMGT